MAINTYIGALLAVSASTPATDDSSGFGALSYTSVGYVMEWGEMGDMNADISHTLLAGRTYHNNGAVDGGEIPATIAYESAGDSGRTIIKAGAAGNTTHSLRFTLPSGKVRYVHGKLRNFRYAAANPTTAETLSFALAANSVVIEV